MNPPIVSCKAPVGLIGGGPVPPKDLETVISVTDRLVAADGGAAAVVAFGAEPDAVIGDFDSLPAAVKAAIPADRLHHIAEQDSTDFDKALRSIEAPVVVAAGVMGGRLDHQLAVLHGLVAHPDRPCIVLNEDEIAFHLPRSLSLPTRANEVISLMPLTQVTGTSTGLQWGIEGLSFDPTRFIGTSNNALGPITLQMHGPGMLGIFPRRLLTAAIEALTQLPPAARWPAL